MTIIVAEKITRAPAGEFAPMAPHAVRAALRDNPAALFLWLEAQAQPEGWSMGNREQMAADLGWSVYQVRRALAALGRVGLYVYERIRDAAGRWSTACRFLANLASSQVTPKVDSAGGGKSRGIPPSREIKRGAPHQPATCWREAAGLPCSSCAKYVAAQRVPTWPAAPASHPAERPVADVLAAERIPARQPVAARVECEHGRRRVACLECVLAGHAG